MIFDADCADKTRIRWIDRCPRSDDAQHRSGDRCHRSPVQLAIALNSCPHPSRRAATVRWAICTPRRSTATPDGPFNRWWECWLACDWALRLPWEHAAKRSCFFAWDRDISRARARDHRIGRGASVLLGSPLAFAFDANVVATGWSASPMNAPAAEIATFGCFGRHTNVRRNGLRTAPPLLFRRMRERLGSPAGRSRIVRTEHVGAAGEMRRIHAAARG